MQKKNFLPTLLTLGIIFLGLCVFYGRVLLHPNSTMLGSSADAIKNYYTPWYHAKWDSSYTWFEGMNYPYGDHVVFADAQPLLSNAIKITGLADYTVGIMNYAMLLSLLAAGWLLLRILLRWRMDAWFAAIAAAAIALLSPQILKFNAHYGLAYAFVVPLVWHLALRAFEKPGWSASLALTVTVFVSGWLHPYYVMISAVFLTALWAVHSLMAWRSTGFWHKLGHFGLQVILPVLLFTLVLKYTDPVTDRPSNPYGLDQYIASWKTIFMPLALVGFDKIPQAIWKGQTVNWEGIGYIGMVATSIFVGYWGWTTWRLGKHIWGRKLRQFRWLNLGEDAPETRMLIVVSMLAGLLVGLFACGIPFAIKPDRMTELFPPIRQFRSLGRFSWVFFYTWTAFAFYLLWQALMVLHTRKLKWLSWFLGGLALILTLAEGGAMNAGVQQRIVLANPDYPGVKPEEMLLGAPTPSWLGLIAGHDKPLLFLPLFHEGSENFHTDSTQNSRTAFQTSIDLGRPMLNVMMSRSSLSQTWGLLELVTEPHGSLEICAAMDCEKGIDCFRSGYAAHFDGPLVRPVGDIKTIDGGELYSIHPLQQMGDLLKASRLPDSLFTTPTHLQTSRAEPGLLWLDFEDEIGKGHRDGTEPGYHGGIGRRIGLKDNNFMHDGPVAFAAGDTVIVSLWIKMREDRLPLTELGWEEWEGDQKITWHYLSLNNSIQRLDGEWALCEREEVVRDPHHKIQINLTRWKLDPPGVTIDKIMVRRKGTDVYGFQDGKAVWKNNRWTVIQQF